MIRKGFPWICPMNRKTGLSLWPTCPCSSFNLDAKIRSPRAHSLNMFKKSWSSDGHLSSGMGSSFSGACNRWRQNNYHLTKGLTLYLWLNFIETWPRKRNKRNMITSLSVSSDWVGATHVQHKKTNTFEKSEKGRFVSEGREQLYTGYSHSCKSALRFN